MIAINFLKCLGLPYVLQTYGKPLISQDFHFLRAVNTSFTVQPFCWTFGSELPIYRKLRKLKYRFPHRCNANYYHTCIISGYAAVWLANWLNNWNKSKHTGPWVSVLFSCHVNRPSALGCYLADELSHTCQTRWVAYLRIYHALWGAMFN